MRSGSTIATPRETATTATPRETATPHHRIARSHSFHGFCSKETDAMNRYFSTMIDDLLTPGHRRGMMDG